MKSKSLLVLGIIMFAGAVLALATQPWVTVQLSEGAAAVTALEITGQQVNASLSPVALASLAGALAITIAGRVFRIVLGALVTLLGAGIAWIAAYVYVDTSSSYVVRVSEATGLTGSGHADLVQSVAISPLVAIVCGLGLLLALAGIGVLIFGPRWKSAGRKYSADTAEATNRASQQQGSSDRFDDWDSLSQGGDPTSSD